MDANTGYTVEMISKHIIKPSSPTPHHIKNHKLSLIDQLAPPAYIPLIFFYEADDESKSLTSINHAEISQKLKQSLSKTLTLFYPLAGKLDKETFMVDCNDAGVEFTEARVLQTRLLDVVQNPILEQLKAYIPVNVSDGVSPDLLLAVQINFFDCGGVAVGVCISHQVGDGISAFAFVNSWAAICRGVKQPRPPCLGLLARNFPARDLPAGSKVLAMPLSVSKEKVVTKTYLFDKKKLEALKVLFDTNPDSSSNTVKNPTRVELISAFIWKHFINDKWNQKNILAALHAVNLRPRSNSDDDDLELEHVFGNYYLHSVAFSGAAFKQYEPGVGELVSKLRHSIRRIDDEYIKNAQRGDAFLGEIGEFLGRVSEGEIDVCLFTSWCKFPVYDVDYGWGKPVWVGRTPLRSNNTLFMSIKPFLFY